MIDTTKFVVRARREMKHLRLRVAGPTKARHSTLHIVGCQRSGTTMFTEILDQDPRVRVFGELESLFDDRPRHQRLKDPTDVRRQLDRSGAALNVVKPLVESHRIGELLHIGRDAVAIWMFRHYRDVASSNLKRFGIRNGIDNLRPIVDDDPDDWRNAGLTAETREVVRGLFDEQMPPHDASALFWYCRNTLFFQQGLEVEPKVRLCQYEQLVIDPTTMMRATYDWIGLATRPERTSDLVHAKSVGKGRNEIGANVRTLCDSMWNHLIETDGERSLLAPS